MKKIDEHLNECRIGSNKVLRGEDVNRETLKRGRGERIDPYRGETDDR
jgi:hypothetical protein